MDTLERLILDFWERPLPEVSPRLVTLPDAPKMARVVIGMRRSGKTYLLFQEIQRLLASGVDRRRILYLNFEDDRLQPLETRVLNDMLETFYRLNPASRAEGAYFFLDEIQAVDGWSRFARRVLDTEDVRLYVTGSSAKMLSTEVSTEFRGRGLAVELLPMSFPEVLLLKGIELPVSRPGSRVRSQLESEFSSYLRAGGFPNVQSSPETDRIQTLQDYVQLVLLRDIIDRHNVKNSHAAQSFALSLLRSSGSLMSVNRLNNDLKSRGVSVGKDTLYSLLDHFVDAYLLFTVPLFTRSLRVREVNAKKVYAIDPGLAFAVAPAGTSNVGSRLEAAVYLELRRRMRAARDGAISYYVTGAGHEVDFIVGDAEAGHAAQLVQVCADLSQEETRDRELRALDEAMEETGLATSTIVTMGAWETVEVPAGTVNVVPAWAWMLGLG
ncbi:MAG: ATP-binding protein [Coriobacteriia bacterium]